MQFQMIMYLTWFCKSVNSRSQEKNRKITVTNAVVIREIKYWDNFKIISKYSRGSHKPRFKHYIPGWFAFFFSCCCYAYYQNTFFMFCCLSGGYHVAKGHDSNKSHKYSGPGTVWQATLSTKLTIDAVKLRLHCH